MSNEIEDKTCSANECENLACTQEDYDQQVAPTYQDAVTYMTEVFCLECIKKLLEDEQPTHKRRLY